MEYFHSLKLQFAVDGAGNKIMNVFHRELTIVSPTCRSKAILGKTFSRKYRILSHALTAINAHPEKAASLIHSFILHIYIAPLQENYSEAPPTPARLKVQCSTVNKLQRWIKKMQLMHQQQRSILRNYVCCSSRSSRRRRRSLKNKPTITRLGNRLGLLTVCYDINRLCLNWRKAYAERLYIWTTVRFILWMIECYFTHKEWLPVYHCYAMHEAVAPYSNLFLINRTWLPFRI